MSDRKTDDILEQENPAEEATTPTGEPAEQPKSELTELEQLQNDLAAQNDRYLRLAAEYDNFRKRTLREREAAWTDATASAATQFLVVMDNIERALEAPCADEEYKKGVSLTAKSFTDLLEKLHIEAFGASGEPFDPERHNAVMHVEEEDYDSPTVIEVFQKGYKMDDRVLRYAMVKVAN